VSKVSILLPHIPEEKIPPTEVSLSLGPNIPDVKLSLHIIHHRRMGYMLKTDKNITFFFFLGVEIQSVFHINLIISYFAV
jgi:hypothetical protein